MCSYDFKLLTVSENIHPVVCVYGAHLKYVFQIGAFSVSIGRWTWPASDAAFGWWVRCLLSRPPHGEAGHGASHSWTRLRDLLAASCRLVPVLCLGKAPGISTGMLGVTWSTGQTDRPPFGGSAALTAGCSPSLWTAHGSAAVLPWPPPASPHEGCPSTSSFGGQSSGR